MSVQDIADFESNLQKLCEFWKAKLTHAELVGTLDTVKMGYHISTIQGFVKPETPAPLKVPEGQRMVQDPNTGAGSPLPAEVADG